MKNPLSGKLGPIAAGLAASSLMVGWLGVAGALPSVVQQPFSAIAEVITDPTTAPGDTTTSAAGDTTTSAAGDTTTSASGDVTTTTAAIDPTSTTMADDDDQREDEADEQASEKNCGRFHAGPECKRPVTPGWARDGHKDNSGDDTSTTVTSATRTDREDD